MRVNAKIENFIRASQGITNPDNDYFAHITQLHAQNESSENGIVGLQFVTNPVFLNFTYGKMSMKMDFNNLFRDLSKSVESAKYKIKDGQTKSTE